MKEPLIKVGICEAYPEIRGRLSGDYRLKGLLVQGGFVVRPQEGAVVLFDSRGRRIAREPVLHLRADPGSTFALEGVTVGLKFHWERREDLSYVGDLVVIAEPAGALTAINELPLEDYLLSVVSSEMNGQAPLAFLMAHAVASRSWLLAMLGGRSRETSAPPPPREGELIRWYERQDHLLYDVCADDHCQRYQGIRAVADRPSQAVRRTRGVVLVHAGEVCDARYHKACGGLTEEFSTCWEDREVPYLSSVSDGPSPQPPLMGEREVRRWIASLPDAYCRIADEELLGRILTPLDRTTKDFFRWQVTVGRPELEEILRQKGGLDVGTLQDLVPLKRGPSGRLSLLKVVGSRGTFTIGKELEIRRLLSPSHLLSSAFFVEAKRGSSGEPSSFTFFGAGWGHGVGMCQVGAAVMAHRGFDHEQILRHYFSGARLVKRY